MKNANQHIRLTNEYFNAFTYDAMGNILTQQRHNRAGNQFDDLTYHYQKDANGNLERNRLYHVNDAISAGFDSTDIDDMGAFISAINQINSDNNYVYDKEGRLVKDKQEEIDTILWTVTGKVREIRRNDTSHKKNLKFNYDAFGRRIAKHVYNNETAMLEKSTYYILDAQGNQLSMYEHFVEDNTAKFYLAERNIYGSSRLGTTNDTVNMFMPKILPSYGVLGNRQYELSNHLGNVLTVINDVKYPLSNDNVSISGYEVGINGVSDYSPFGVPLDGRTVGRLGKYGFNSQERDNEVSGKGNSYTAEFWQYSPRLGRRWDLDPKPNISISPYATFGNNPIMFSDFYGDTIRIRGTKNEAGKRETYTLRGGNAYDRKGNLYERGTDDFVDRALNAINEIENSGKTGTELVSDINDSKQTTFIAFEKDRQYHNGSTIYMDFGMNTTVPTENSEEDLMPNWLVLGHELAHASDGVTSGIWFEKGHTFGNGEVIDQKIYNSEKYATHIENKMRAEKGLPLRVRYTPNIVETNLMIIKGVSRFFTHTIHANIKIPHTETFQGININGSFKFGYNYRNPISTPKEEYDENR